MSSDKKEKKSPGDKARKSWLARSGSRDERQFRKSIATADSSAPNTPSLPAPSTPEPKKWHKGDVMSSTVLARQRTLEQFLLKFDMKHLRGTSWKYYDISTSLDDELSTPLSPSPSSPADALSSSPANTAAPIAQSSSTSNPALAAPPSYPAPPPPSAGAPSLVVEGPGEGFTASPKVRRSVAAASGLSGSVNDLDDPSKYAKEAIVIIPPGGVRPEAMFEHIIGFASRGFRVIAPRVPETLDDFEDYSAGILLIMRQEKVGRAHFLGLGMGGMIAQHLIYRYPERALTVTLAHTNPPDEEMMPRVEKALTNKQYGAEVLSNYLLGFKIKEKDLDADMRNIKGDEKTLWIVFMKQFQTSKLTAARYTQALVNYHRDIAFIPGDFKRFKGDVFLIESQLPQYAVALEEQRALFPSATLYTYQSKGPLYSLVRGNKTAQRVVEFIRQSRAIRKRKKAEKEKLSLLTPSVEQSELKPPEGTPKKSRRKP